jgi:protein deglycase
MARVLIPLAEGFEEIEAVTVVDLLRRAGIEVCTAALARRSGADETKFSSEPNFSSGPNSSPEPNQPNQSAGSPGPGAALVVGSHGIGVCADAMLADVDDAAYDMIVLPGGMPGAAHLKEDARVLDLLQRASARGSFIAAICAAPGVLAHAGLLDGRAATSFPGFLDGQSAPGLQLSTAPVVIDGRIVTSRGPGTAIDFALTLIELLVGGRVRAETESRLQRPQPTA